MTGGGPGASPSLVSMCRYFLRLGAVGFGGPAALADRMRADLVDARRWLTPAEYDRGLAIAAACPGPLAYQLAVYCGYVRHGLNGAVGVAVTFALVPFVLVAVAAAAYERWSDNGLVRGMFYGAGPVIVSLIGWACWRLGRRTLHRAWPAWAMCTVGGVVTWMTGREPLWLFLISGLLGAVLLRPATGSARPAATAVVAADGPGDHAPFAVVAALASAGSNAQLFGFFFKTGCLVFGSGLVIVPFLQSAVVDGYGWLTPRQFLDAVTIGLVSPGPVVITATFVGYQVGHLAGALAATVGMFLPAVLFTVGATPWFTRHGDRPVLMGLVRGVTAAVVGVLAGTVPLVARSAVPDVPAAVILIVCGMAMAKRVVPDPVLVALGAVAGAAMMAAR